MLRVRRIDTLDLPELAPYRTMRRPLEHRQQGIFVAEGEKVVRRMLDSDLTILSLLLPEPWFHAHEPLLAARREEIAVFLADKALLEQLIGFAMYQGVLGVARVPPPLALEELLPRSPRPRLLVAIEGLANAENVGALIRNCAAFGVQGLIVGETCSSPWLRRSVRSSMGTIFKLPCVETPNLVTALSWLGREGVRCVAAHPRSDGATLARADLRGDCCLVFGAEGAGLSSAVLDVCAEAAAIPMHNDVDSLNVGSASAVFLYEANRQRGRG
jgi:tRNA G18 (ribose-2'-O)-methylase SpoU